MWVRNTNCLYPPSPLTPLSLMPFLGNAPCSCLLLGFSFLSAFLWCNTWHTVTERGFLTHLSLPVVPDSRECPHSWVYSLSLAQVCHTTCCTELNLRFNSDLTVYHSTPSFFPLGTLRGFPALDLSLMLTVSCLALSIMKTPVHNIFIYQCLQINTLCAVTHSILTSASPSYRWKNRPEKVSRLSKVTQLIRSVAKNSEQAACS